MSEKRKLERKIHRINHSTLEEMIEMIKRDASLLKHCEDVAEHPNFVMTLIQEVGGDCLQYISDDRIRNDPKIVLAAVQQNGYSLQYASDFLRDDPDIVLAAIRQNGYSLWFASERVRNFKSIVMESVSRNGNALQFASSELRRDMEIVSCAVKNNGLALSYAASSLLGNWSTVHAAVAQNAYALQYASAELRDDVDIVATATLRNGGTLPLALIGPKVCTELRAVVDFLLYRQAGRRSKKIEGLSYRGLMVQLQADWNEMLWLLQQKNITHEQLEAIFSYSDLKERNANIVLAKRYEPIFSVVCGTTWEEKVNILAISGLVGVSSDKFNHV